MKNKIHIHLTLAPQEAEWLATAMGVGGLGPDLKKFYWYCENNICQPVAVFEDRVYFFGTEMYVSKTTLEGTFTQLNPPDAVLTNAMHSDGEGRCPVHYGA